jgi:hypothetical protein
MTPDVSAGPVATKPGLLGRLSGYVASGLRYWELRRLAYNAVLALIVIIHFLLARPEATARVSVDLLLGIFLLAVLANIAYCVVYVGDVFLQFSGLEEATRWGRPILFAVGTAFAATITHFFAKALFSP